jgi:predicted permease
MPSDLRNAARILAKSPGFTLTVVALLSTGLAATTLIFSLVDALLLRPLPVRDPSQLVRLVTVRETLGVRGEFLFEEYQAWAKHVAGFQDTLAWSEQDVFVNAANATSRSRVDFVTGNFFASLGTQPALGRLLTPIDDTPGSDTIPIVLSHHFWRQRFRQDPAILGQTLTLNGRKAVIVGVTARNFNGLKVETSPDLRAPIVWTKTIQPDLFEGRVPVEVVARLRPGAALPVARQQAEAVWAASWKELNPTDPGLPGRFDLQPAARGISRLRTQFTGALWMLLGGVSLLMLLVCANIAGLLMARTAGRQSELALRVALGANRWRLIRQLFSESLLLMLGGAAGAIALSAALLPLLVKALPPVRDFGATRLPLTLEISPDWRVLGFTLLLSALGVLLFGLLPAFTAARQDIHPFLRQARTGGGWRGRLALVTCQVALCTILLTGAGLTLLTLSHLRHLNPGFSQDRVISFTVDPDMARYTAAEAGRLQHRLQQQAAQLPDVQSASITSRGLMRGTGIKTTIAPAGERARPGDFMNTSIHTVSPEYFTTLQIPWVAGRNFEANVDPEAKPKPIIVNQAFVRRFSPGRDILGRTFGNANMNGAAAEAVFQVIGVVGDTKYRSLREPFLPIFYAPTGPAAEGTFSLQLRTRSAPETVITPMRELLKSIDPRFTFLEINTLAQEVQASLWAEQVSAVLATGFSVAGALIVAAGLYGLVAFTLAQRRRELGIRLALGATPNQVVRLVLSRAARLAVAGIALGLTAAALVTPRLAPLLYEVNPRNAKALAASAAGVFLITALAALLPALAATRRPTAEVLRQD